MRFSNRTDAGRKLARALHGRPAGEKMVVFGLPRGGVVVAVEVALALGAPLDLIITRKIGHPLSSEYAIGAVGEHSYVMNPQEKRYVGCRWLQVRIEQERAEAKRRRVRYLGGRTSSPAEGRTAIIVDDGVATGLTLFAAIEELKLLRPSRIVVAVPVAPLETCLEIESQVDELVCLERDRFFQGGVSAYFDDFPQVSDEEVIRVLGGAAQAESRRAEEWNPPQGVQPCADITKKR